MSNHCFPYLLRLGSNFIELLQKFYFFIFLFIYIVNLIESVASDKTSPPFKILCLKLTLENH